MGNFRADGLLERWTFEHRICAIERNLYVCGIVALLPRYDRAGEPLQDDALTDALRWELPSGAAAAADVSAALGESLTRTEGALRLLATAAALAQVAVDDELRRSVRAALDTLERELTDLDARLDGTPDEVEHAQSLILGLRDALWTLRNDRLGSAERIRALGFGDLADPRLAVSYLAVDAVLEAIDRLEVRGRDSAGIQIWVGLDERDRAAVAEEAGSPDDLYRFGAVEVVNDGVVFVRKRAAVLGALGDNVAHLRAGIAADERLAHALRLPSARVSVLAHSRWASVGRISESNAHPVNSVSGGRGRPFAAAVLNGDIDNHVSLRRVHAVPADDITTDAKIIPVLHAEALAGGLGTGEALLSCVARFHGSMAIAAQAEAGRVALAVKGSGQGLYVGLAPWCYLVASEVYGLVAWADRYLRLDGSTADGPVAVVLDAERAGTLEGITEIAGDGSRRTAGCAPLEITTRDVARGDFDHYLVKEIAGAPRSFQRSLRGRIVEAGGRLTVSVGEAGLAAGAARRPRPRPVDRDRAGRPGHRRGRLPGNRRGDPATPAGAAGAGRAGHRAFRRPAARRHERRRPPSRSASLAPPPTPTAPSTWRATAAPRCSRSSTGATATSRTSATACSTPRTAGTWRWPSPPPRRSTRRSPPACCSGCRSPSRGGACGPRRSTTCWSACRRCRATWRPCGSSGTGDHRRRRGPPQHADPGRSSTRGLNRVAAAEVRIKLLPSCATAPSPATRWRTKHIDLSAEALIIVCAASTRHNSFATWPRRSRSSRPTERARGHRRRPDVEHPVGVR